MISCRIEIINKLGLHARAATKLASTTGRYGCTIRTGKKEPLVDAKSVMSLMLLAAGKGTHLLFEFNGEDEIEAHQAVSQLLADYFGEGE
ncbi:MAG: HPr family phosphocarrier protein [Porticoccaceae bacterium]|nr:MAG: phosphocarrier protein HPr [SAR92 bacterium BACL16 MAG-120619-bin48]KRP27023.1 MAG: phosphocarrier protein HPr [SAR92 bacterium BACL16 MAG-120322-bin99]MDO7634961.1 HPr family phosphocarrier protein [Porticoccaceae bacterium]MDP4655151.1 HPr family phosphocarrier protein [Alphaproteobacteria bacterium]MDP4745894.1 HPr family phosphocarrier protein [Porticoccaceae bacterium]